MESSLAYFNEGICVLEFFSEERQDAREGEVGLSELPLFLCTVCVRSDRESVSKRLSSESILLFSKRGKTIIRTSQTKQI